MALETLDIVNGSLSLIVVILFTYVGAKIASTYSKRKNKVFLLIGLGWIGIASPWWPSMVSFLMAVATGGDGLYNSPEIYFIIGNVLIPLFLLLWLGGFTELIHKEKQKVIITIYLIYGIIFEIVFFMLLTTNPSAIGFLETPVDVKYLSFVLIYLLSIIVTLLVTGVMFGRASLKQDDPELKLKGKMLIIAIILFSVGALLDSALELTIVTVFITRIILFMSAFLFYGGFILPAWMKKIFLRK